MLGTTARTAAVVADTGCDIVLFAGGAVASAQQMRRAAWELADSPVQIMLVPGLTDVANDRVRVRPAAGLQLMELEGPRAQAATRISKRLFDFLGASLLLVLTSPLFIGTAIAIRLHDGGPVLFRQQRVGRNGDLFDCYKFRSMVVDADALSTPSPPRTSTRRATSSSRPSTTRGSPDRAGSSVASRSTSCRSSSTCCAAR